jgi:DNA-binding CsgD family transcriptional regulator
MLLDVETTTIPKIPPKDIGAAAPTGLAAISQPTPAPLLAAAIDSLGLALFVVDGQGRVVAASQGTASCVASRVAVAAAAPSLVRRARREGRPVGQAVDTDKARQIWLVATPMGSPDGAPAQHFAIQAIDANGPQQIDAGLLAELCGLTPAEAQVIRLVADGLAPKLIATRLGISLATVKTHLHRGFRKTGSRGQADLVRRIARVAPQRRAI